MTGRLLGDKMFLGKTPTLTGTPWKDGKTPSKTPMKTKKGLSAKTPNKSGSHTPHHGQDRFIPNRSAMDLETSHHLITNIENVDPDEEMSPERAQFQTNMTRALSEGQLNEHKVLAFKQRPPQAKEGYLNSLKVLYSGKNQGPAKKTSVVARQIPQQPERILDAPELLDNYYLNLLDWSSNNHVALALGPAVYLWNAGNGSISQVMQLEDADDYISSVSWVKEGTFLAIGNSLGHVQLWDSSQPKLVRTMLGHAGRVGSLDWNSYILSSGSRAGTIHHHDVRVPEHHVATLTNHTQEVCGLSWSPDGKHLASGANDNLVNIWDTALGHDVAPLHTFTHHQAAVKALAWCPWQPSLLASGGGTADRHIRFWNISTGSCVQSVNAHSQVSSLRWSSHYKELISGHGYSQNQLTIWKYPAMTRVANLLGHQSRILCLSMSPDGSTVASAAGDETLRLWKCFEVDKAAKKASTKSVSKSTASSSLELKGIR